MQDPHKIPNSPWWLYLISVGFIIYGRSLVKKYKKEKVPGEKYWNETLTKQGYLTSGIAGIVGGGIFIIISLLRLFGVMN
jgi:hypothetical protein